MNTFSVNEAKMHLADLLLKVQKTPIQINEDGQSAAVMISTDEYQQIEALKLQLLQFRAAQAITDIKAGNLVDGSTFFDGLTYLYTNVYE